MKERLMTPGPVAVPAHVLAEQALPMVHHRSRHFRAAYDVLRGGLQQALGLGEGDVFLIPGSGTAAMEAAIVNLFSPGQRVLAVCNGFFGERWAAIAQTYGLDVERLDIPWGRPADPALVQERLAAQRAVAGVLVTFHETSTGVVSDLAALGEAVRPSGALLAVDAVSGLAISPLRMDEWGLDCVVSASQKGLASPPGIGIVALNGRAWAACESSTAGRFYLDLRRFRDASRTGITPSPWTPPITTIRAMQQSLQQLLAEGLETVYARQQRLAWAAQAGLEAMGLELLVAPPHRSQGVTVALAPQGITPREIVERMHDDWGVTMAGGIGPLAAKTLRIAHMGAVDLLDVIGTLFALEETLHRLGAPVEPGASARGIHAVIDGSGHEDS